MQREVRMLPVRVIGDHRPSIDILVKAIDWLLSLPMPEPENNSEEEKPDA